MEKYDAVNYQHLLIKSYCYWLKEPDADKANRLVEVAKASGYCEPDQTLTGSRLNNWVRNERAPIWAYKAAAEALLKTEYFPETDNETAGLAITLCALAKDQEDLPDHLQQVPLLCSLLVSFR
ncbi:hypothetical protein A9Q99_06190 [Gammaproteobacteria bacterium 45_16_T64]|nr:hypothetical protein A9Q99_06190 [Gammaproteobacteria bacterium 45_16_T64]